MSEFRFIVGIDLGTTHCALAYLDLSEGEDGPIRLFEVPQVTEPGNVDPSRLLPSFLYLAAAHELPEGSLDLPWARDRSFVVGEMARARGSEVPGRVVASAKSWLRHTGVDRSAPMLPWEAPEDVEKLSALGASTRYLEHLRDAWNHAVAGEDEGARLEQQEVYLTVPASFDAAARDLTARAAEQAGLEHVTLLEEPQAAFYAWLESQGEAWRDRVHVGDRILVCDVGGGTTDLSLIAVEAQHGELALERIAVGEHILLGGDNMDLALAHMAAQKLKSDGHAVDAWQMRSLWHQCRAAKETLLADSRVESAPIVVVGRGSKLIGGTIRTDLTRAEVEAAIVGGFFPECGADAVPESKRRAGMRELGLPYEADPAVTRHVARFLARHASAHGLMSTAVGARAAAKSDASAETGASETEVSAETAAPAGASETEISAETAAPAHAGASTATGPPSPATANGTRYPNRVLFNGGVMKATGIQTRVVELLGRWTTEQGGGAVEVLGGTDLDLAVARGAVYYGLARRGRGVRIRGGTARTYYIGVESALPAVPGMPSPLKALCVVPFGMEEGDEHAIPDAEFGLVVGEPVEFRFLGSTTRQDDAPGMLIDHWIDDIEELTPMVTTLPAGDVEGGEVGTTIPVRLHTKVTELGTLELWCVSRDGRGRWKLEFEVRERDPSLA
jgi:hypothetical protein